MSFTFQNFNLFDIVHRNMAFLRKICCCGDEEDDLSGPYERLSEDGTIAVIRQRNQDSSGSYGGQEYGDRGLQGHAPSKEQDEEEIMNSILDQTQQNTIDVSHMDYMTLSNEEYLQKHQRYNKAVKEHDANPNAKKPVRTANANIYTATPSAVAASSVSKKGVLLEDSGNKIADRLTKVQLSDEKLKEYSSIVDEIASAVKSMKIVHKKELIANMSL